MNKICIVYFVPLYFLIEEWANIKFGSKNVFDFLIFWKDLKAKIAIGSSVQPNIILPHFILTNKFTAGRIAFSASFILY